MPAVPDNFERLRSDYMVELHLKVMQQPAGPGLALLQPQNPEIQSKNSAYRNVSSRRRRTHSCYYVHPLLARYGRGAGESSLQIFEHGIQRFWALCIASHIASGSIRVDSGIACRWWRRFLWRCCSTAPWSCPSLCASAIATGALSCSATCLRQQTKVTPLHIHRPERSQQYVNVHLRGDFKGYEHLCKTQVPPVYRLHDTQRGLLWT